MQTIHAQKGDSFYVKLKGTSGNGHFLWFSDKIYVDSTQKPQKPSLLSLLPDSICSNNAYAKPVEFNLDSASHTPNENYRWTLNGAGYRNTVVEDTNITLRPLFEGPLNLWLKYENGLYCNLDTFVNFFVKAGPRPGFVLSDSLACAPANIKLTDFSSGNVVKRCFYWSDGYVDSNSHSRKLDTAAAFSVLQSLTGPNGCNSQDSQKLRILPGKNQFRKPTLLRATVPYNLAVQIDWTPIPAAEGYELVRLQHGEQEVSWTFEDPALKTFVDTPLATDSQFWQYQLYPIDACDSTGYGSNLGTSILMQGENHENRFVSLAWNAYENWESGVQAYELQATTDTTHWQTIATLNQLQHSDSRIPSLGNDTLFYRIKAVELQGQQQTSVSNVVATPIGSTLFIPNAFTPNGDGLNDVFAIGTFGTTDVSCTIYARNGQRIAVSQNPANIWDGTLRGEALPAGDYFYVISALNAKGEMIEKSGKLTLVR